MADKTSSNASTESEGARSSTPARPVKTEPASEPTLVPGTTPLDPKNEVKRDEDGFDGPNDPRRKENRPAAGVIPTRGLPNAPAMSDATPARGVPAGPSSTTR